jgi:hypothetical protein
MIARIDELRFEGIQLEIYATYRIFAGSLPMQA